MLCKRRGARRIAANVAKLPKLLRKTRALILIAPMDLSRLMWCRRCLVCAVLYAEPSFAHCGQALLKRCEPAIHGTRFIYSAPRVILSFGDSGENDR